MRPLRILLIEDDADSGEAMSLLLGSQGFQVHWAHDGEQALAIFRDQGNRGIDLILLDLMLPDMSGTALIERMASAFELPPVVIHTAASAAAAGEAARAMHASEVLRKPTDWSRMRQILGRLGSVHPASDLAPRAGAATRNGAEARST